MLTQDIYVKTVSLSVPVHRERATRFIRRREALLKVSKEIDALRALPSLRMQESRLFQCEKTLSRLGEEEERQPTSAHLRRMIEACRLVLVLRKEGEKLRLPCSPEVRSDVQTELERLRTRIRQLLRGRGPGDGGG